MPAMHPAHLIKFCISVWTSLLVMMLPGMAGAQTESPEPIIDWQKRQAADERLKVFGDDLMGDAIDPHIGSLTFEHTDVSIPGNSSLDVSIRRRLSQGYKYDEGVKVEFGDWELVAPRITAVATTQKGWAGQRCSDSWSVNFPPISIGSQHANFSNAATLHARDYSNGVSMQIPGQGTQQVLKSSSGIRFPTGTKAATVNEWYFTCISADDGGEGFMGHAPNGDKYRFDRVFTRPFKEIGFANKGSIPVARTKIILAATQVTDTYNNYVNYTYDSNNRLIQIKSNDERQIDIGYNNQLIDTVETNGRTWSYVYRNSTYQKEDWDVNGYGTFNSSVLSRVTQPDGKYWSFILDGMQAESHPPAKKCFKQTASLFITHPYGTTGTFKLKDTQHRQAYQYLTNVTDNCLETYDPEPEPPAPGGGGAAPQPIERISTRAMAVLEKKLSSETMEPAIWTFEYEEEDVCFSTTYNPCGTTGGGGGGGGNNPDPDGPLCDEPGCENYFWYPEFGSSRKWNESRLESPKGDQNDTMPTLLASLSINQALPNKSLHFIESEIANGANEAVYQSILSTIKQVTPIQTAQILPLMGTSGTLQQPSPSDDYWFNNPGAVYYSDVMYTSSGNDPIDFTNWTRVTQPNGSVFTYYHLWTWEQSFGGQLIKKSTSSGSTIMDEVDTIYVQHTCNGVALIFAGPSDKPDRCPTHVSSTVQQRDGDTYSSTFTYNMDGAASNYSYGRPTTTSIWSNVSTTPRTTVTEYEHKTANWVMGLPKKVTTNGREMSRYEYNDEGRKLEEYRYDALYAKFNYVNTDGTLQYFEDALGRKTKTLLWKRGTAQRVEMADNSTNNYQYVDDNGWLEKTIDGKGNETNYERDSMGRLTKYVPPPEWRPTHIAYNFGSSITQTITKWGGRTQITYDTMFRPILVKTYLTSSSATTPPSYVQTAYNGAGQTVFTSFPFAEEDFSTAPYDENNPPNGTDFTYDGLGRIFSEKENVVPFAETKHRYYNYHRHRIHDPAGTWTDHYSYGYDGPDNTDYRAIYKYAGGFLQKTYLYKNVWGQMTALRQWGDLGGVPVDEYRRYYYDDQQRLCRYSEPEAGDNLYNYDAAGQLIDYSQGESSGTTCGTNLMTPAKRTTLYYNDLGQNYFTNFWTNATLDTAKTFDDNGNIRTLKRGLGSGTIGDDTVFHTYTYDTINNLTSEKLELDGRTYELGYNYNGNGHVQSRTVKSHGASIRTNAYGVDALGRHTFAKNNGSTAVLDIRYHPNNMIESYDLANSQEFTQTLNPRLLPEHVTSNYGSHKALDMTYAYDARRKVTSTINGAISGDNRTFTYDALGQLDTSTGPWGNGSYDFDSIGNIRAKTEGNRSMVMTYANKNRLTSHTDSVGGTRSLSYDDRGNVIALGAQNFVYDLRNQPISISGTASGTYEYDGNKKRVKSVIEGETLYFVYDASGKLMIVDRPDDSERVYYLHAAGKTMLRYTHRDNSSNSIDYLHNDHLGSANSASGSSGTIKWREQYSPFGERLSQIAANDNLDGFTGHVFDKATGLNYMQARYYDPLIGRFLSIDPVGFDGNPAMFNRYAYTFNDPLNMIDADGRKPDSVMDRQMQGAANAWRQNPRETAMVWGGITAAVGSTFIPGPEDLVVGGVLATKAGQALVQTGSRIASKVTSKFSKTCCFVAGTLVETKDGLRNIEDIKVGNFVLARNPETGETTFKAVTDLIRLNQRQIWEVSLSGNDNTSEFFETTDDHPWWIVDENGEGNWKDTNELSVGMTVTTADNRTMIVTKVVETDRIDATYNLTVADFETYFVGKNKILVHNCTKLKSVGDLNPLHSKETVGSNGDQFKNMSDKELLNTVNNPKNGDFMKESTETGKLVDGNSRAHELQNRALDPSSSISSDTKVPVESYTRDNSMFDN